MCNLLPLRMSRMNICHFTKGYKLQCEESKKMRTKARTSTVCKYSCHLFIHCNNCHRLNTTNIVINFYVHILPNSTSVFFLKSALTRTLQPLSRLTCSCWSQGAAVKVTKATKRQTRRTTIPALGAI